MISLFQNVGEAVPAKWQFDGLQADGVTNAGFMLNTDFELFYNLTLVRYSGSHLM
jgi:hypothetical protein